MKKEKIDLYAYYNIDRNGASGGYLTVCARTETAETRRRSRPAMLVMPGGGYGALSDREGEPVAIKFMSEGFSAFVLKYSVHRKYPVPLVEAMLAVKYIRENADKYSVDSNHICAIGFSAGGHLTGMLGTVKQYEAEFINNSAENVRPNAVILSYPVITMGEYTHLDTRKNITEGDTSLYDKLSVEKRVDKSSAPVFIWHTCNDGEVGVANSLLLAESYRKAGVPFCLHIFENGWHGLSLADDEVCDFIPEHYTMRDAGKWFGLSCDWLKSRDITVNIQ